MPQRWRVVEFSLAPGRFRLDVTVEDSVSGQQMASSVDLVGYTGSPGASDLMLSPAMRPVTGAIPCPSRGAAMGQHPGHHRHPAPADTPQGPSVLLARGVCRQ